VGARTRKSPISKGEYRWAKKRRTLTRQERKDGKHKEYSTAVAQTTNRLPFQVVSERKVIKFGKIYKFKLKEIKA
jgi:hypothetical protein